MAEQSGFFHIVYFYMRPGASAEALAAGCRKFLAGIPGVRRLEVGFPAGTPRLVVDNSYGVVLFVELPDKEAHDVYQEHADHKAFIAECSALWDRVQIYDSLMQ